jgi:hypothetical protein
MAASVWMKSSMAHWLFSSALRPMIPSARPLALMIPEVTVVPSSSGLPMASTHSPMRAVSELPMRVVGKRPSTLITATSVSGSAPTSLAESRRLSCMITSILLARSTTWLLVMM